MVPARWSPRRRIALVLLAVASTLAATLAVGAPTVGTPALGPVAAAEPAPPGSPEADRPPAAADGAYIPPVEAPVVDPFRPPAHPYGPGNRGIEFATVPGTAVRAAGAGVVSFAGPVAGSLHVTVAHPDGIRTSYSFLSDVTVSRGQSVDQGTVVGHAASRFHVGARRGETYIDPASLWGRRGPPRVALVPLDGGGTSAGAPGGG